MVTAQELRAAASMGLRDVKYDAGPIIALVDGPDFEFMWEGRGKLIRSQIQDAELVAISRTDLLNGSDVDRISSVLNEYAGNITSLSIKDGSGIDAVMKLVTANSRTPTRTSRNSHVEFYWR
jgi:G3E family GTPase